MRRLENEFDAFDVLNAFPSFLAKLINFGQFIGYPLLKSLYKINENNLNEMWKHHGRAYFHTWNYLCFELSHRNEIDLNPNLNVEWSKNSTFLFGQDVYRKKSFKDVDSHKVYWD